MATFKVGRRVKRVAQGPGLLPIPLGTTGTVIGDDGFMFGQHWTRVQWDIDLAPDYCSVFTDTLAPLTDPSADAFIDRLKKLGKEPVVLTPAELERVAGGGK